MGKVLHASYSGWFPFCIASGGTTGQGTDYPLGLSLAKAMELYWKVKQWRVELNQDGTTADFNFERVGELEAGNPTKEEDLVCSFPIGGDFFPAGFDQIGISMFSGPSNVVFSGGNYYPKINLSGNIVANSWQTIDDGILTQVGSITISGFGSINCYGSSGIILTGTISPIEYWPYA